ncbi:sigma-70 family RNA polymerase sigma factor [Streptomyces sp. NPDC088115]|uniref:sigma-70 family RNA polymerase sigma factor n=1 Tax=Streptomyces sp. NPDC088115 TaxID=3365824 RepID=UPI0037F7779B
MTLLDLSTAPSRPAPATVVRTLYPLVSAEAGAEAAASATGAAVDRADLEQAVWLRLLERLPEQGPPKDAARWVRDTVRGEAHRARRTVRHERPYRDETAPDPAGSPERAFAGADQRRLLRAAVDRLPARCARLLTALLAPNDPTYREIAGELAMSQGSLGPIRSRCLGCLRRMLAAEVVAPEPRGKER